MIFVQGLPLSQRTQTEILGAHVRLIPEQLKEEPPLVEPPRVVNGRISEAVPLRVRASIVREVPDLVWMLPVSVVPMMEKILVFFSFCLQGLEGNIMI